MQITLFHKLAVIISRKNIYIFPMFINLLKHFPPNLCLKDCEETPPLLGSGFLSATQRQSGWYTRKPCLCLFHCHIEPIYQRWRQIWYDFSAIIWETLCGKLVIAVGAILSSWHKVTWEDLNWAESFWSFLDLIVGDDNDAKHASLSRLHFLIVR